MSDLETVRDWVGSQPDDPAINAALLRFDGEGDPALRAALSILRRRRADNQFSSFAVDGDTSWNQTSWLADLDRKIAQLQARIGGDEVDGGLTTAPIVGPGNLR